MLFAVFIYCTTAIMSYVASVLRLRARVCLSYSTSIEYLSYIMSTLQAHLHPPIPDGWHDGSQRNKREIDDYDCVTVEKHLSSLTELMFYALAHSIVLQEGDNNQSNIDRPRRPLATCVAEMENRITYIGG